MITGLFRELFGPDRTWASLTREEANYYRAEWGRRKTTRLKTLGEPTPSTNWYRRNKDVVNAARRKQWAGGSKRRLKHREWRKKNPDKARRYKLKWRAKNKDKIRAQNRAWRRRYPEKDKLHGRRCGLKTNYGITIEFYDALLAAQDFRCAICRAEKSNKKGHRLAIDHDHDTGRVRGLLCAHCNWAIGHFRNNPNFLRSAAAYLEHQGSVYVGEDRRQAS